MSDTKDDIIREAYRMAQEHYAEFGNHDWPAKMRIADWKKLSDLQQQALFLVNKLFHATQAGKEDGE